MNKKLVALVVVIIALIAGGLIYLSSSNPKSGNSNTEQNSKKTSNETPQQTSQGGTYKEYESGSIASTSGTKILFFHAPWCPQCRALEADIKASSIPENVTIFKVDYDSNQALRQKYGVTIQTTLVKVDNEGNLIEKFVAYDKPTLAEVIRNLL